MDSEGKLSTSTSNHETTGSKQAERLDFSIESNNNGNIEPGQLVEKTEQRSKEQSAEVQSVNSELSDVSIPVSLPQTKKDDDGKDAHFQPILPTDSTQASLSADDADLIEREWVDKAKKIVEDTKDDPHKREDEVGKMQVEYIKKRYGRKIGSTK